MDSKESVDEDQLAEALKDECTVIQGKRNRKQHSRCLMQSNAVEQKSDTNIATNERENQRVITTSVRHSIRVVANKRNPSNEKENVESVATIDRIFETNVYQKYAKSQQNVLNEYLKEKARRKLNLPSENFRKGIRNKIGGNNNTTVYQAEYIPDQETQKKKTPKAKNSKTSIKSKPKHPIKNVSSESTESYSEDSSETSTSTSSSSLSRSLRISYDYAYANWLQMQYSYYNPRYLNSAAGYRGPQFPNPGYYGPHRYSHPSYYYDNQYLGYINGPRYSQYPLMTTASGYYPSQLLYPPYQPPYAPFPQYVDPFWPLPQRQQPTFSRYEVPMTDNYRKKRESPKRRRHRIRLYSSSGGISRNRSNHQSTEKIGESKRIDKNLEDQHFGTKKKLSFPVSKKLSAVKERKTPKQKVGKNIVSKVVKGVRSKIAPTSRDNNNNTVDNNNNMSLNKPSTSKRFIEIDNGWNEQLYQVTQVYERSLNSKVNITSVSNISFVKSISPTKLEKGKSVKTLLPPRSKGSDLLSLRTDFLLKSSESEDKEGEQKEDEWLAYSESASTWASEIQIVENPPLVDGMEKECGEFMQETIPLFKCMRAFGRMPLTMSIEDKCMNFSMDRRSSTFYIFCATTFVITYMCFMLFYGASVVFFFEKPFHFYEEIQRLEFDKYWCIAMITFFHMAYIVSWSLAIIFGDGLHLAEFMTRWNLALITTKYSSVAINIKRQIMMEFGACLMYSLAVIIIFIGDFIPAIRGSSGFIAMSILEPFVFRVRLHRNFLAFQTFGLFVHLYMVFSSRVITVFVLVYCRILENFTKRWNLRLAYRLEQVGKRKGSQILLYRKIIPYTKLFAEHIVVSSFLAHTGKVFAGAIIPFYILKSFELIMVIYNCASYIMLGMPRFNDTYVNVDAVTREAVPITYTDPDGMIVGVAYFYLAVSVFGCFYTTELIHNCGWAFVCGYGFIRRHGLALCKTTAERRFILSLQNMFAPRNKFYIAPGIDRAFSLKFWGTVFVFLIFLLQFSPDRLQKETITICNGKGVCVEITLAKGTPFYREIVNAATNGSLGNLGHEWPCKRQCNRMKSISSLGAKVLPLEAYKECPKDPVSEKNNFYIPLLFNSNHQPVPPFQNSHLKDTQCSASVHGPYTFVETKHLRNCAGETVDISEMKRDDCGNLPIKTFNFHHKSFKPPTLHYTSLKVKDVSYVVCCFEYNGLQIPGGKKHEQFQKCNIPRWSDDRVVSRRCDIQPNSIVDRRTKLTYSKYITDPNYILFGKAEKVLNDCACKHFPFTSGHVSECEELENNIHFAQPRTRESQVRCLAYGGTIVYHYPMIFNEFGYAVFPFQKNLNLKCDFISGNMLYSEIGYLEDVTSYDTEPHNDLYDYFGNRISSSGSDPVVLDDCGNIGVSVPNYVDAPFELIMFTPGISGLAKDMLVCCFDYPFAVKTDSPQDQVVFCNVQIKSMMKTQCAGRFSRLTHTATENKFLMEYPNFKNLRYTDISNSTKINIKEWTQCICQRTNSWLKLGAADKKTITQACKRLHPEWEPPAAG